MTKTTRTRTLMNDEEDGVGETENESGKIPRRHRNVANGDEGDGAIGLPNEQPNGHVSIGNVYRRSQLLKDSLVDYFERNDDAHADER